MRPAITRAAGALSEMPSAPSTRGGAAGCVGRACSDPHNHPHSLVTERHAGDKQIYIQCMVVYVHGTRPVAVEKNVGGRHQLTHLSAGRPHHLAPPPRMAAIVEAQPFPLWPPSRDGGNGGAWRDGGSSGGGDPHPPPRARHGGAAAAPSPLGGVMALRRPLPRRRRQRQTVCRRDRARAGMVPERGHPTGGGGPHQSLATMTRG